MGVKSLYRTERWKAVRLEAKRRAGWKCEDCGARGVRLEVHHTKRAIHHPESFFDLATLRVLCVSCHSKITRIEVGMGAELSPARAAWRDLLATMAKPQTNEVPKC